MKFSIREKLMLLLSLPAIMVLIFFFYSVFNQSRLIEDNYNRFGNALAAQLSLTAQYGAMTGNYDAELDDFVRIVAIHSVKGLKIINSQGIVVVQQGGYFNSPALHTPRDHYCEEGNGYRVYCANIEMDSLEVSDFSQQHPEKTILGRVEIAMLHTELNINMERLWKNSLLSLFVAIVVALLLHLMVRKLITRPVDRLANWVEDIGNGTLATHEDIADSGEFFQLQEAMNRMITQIDDHQHNLEHQISVATAELCESLKRLEERNHDLIHERYRAEGASRSKSQFLATMSHEIRTPINAISGLTQILLNDSLSPHQCELLHHMEDSGEILLGLVNDILDFSRIEAGRLAIDRKRFQVRDLLKRAGNMFHSMVDERPIRLELEADERIPQYLLGDQLRIEQIIINLLGNALKFTQKGFIRIKINMLDLNSAGCFIRVTVEDSGIGIQEEKLQHLFEPFYQADQSANERYGGSGLGLSICHRLVKLMGGSLAVVSHPHQGSQFSFDLLLGLTLDGDAVDEVVIEHQQGDLAGLNILLAEDNHLNQLVVVELCQKEGIIVTVAGDGKEALELLAKDHFDLVLMDLQMPVMDGFATTRVIRTKEELKDLPVIAMTAHALEDARIDAIAAGMDDFITKPFRMDALRTMLIEKMGMGKMNEENKNITSDPVTASLPQFSGLNIKETLQRFSGNIDLFQRLLVEFYHGHSNFVEEIEEVKKGGHSTQLMELCHSMKGVSATMGAVDLNRASERIVGQLRERRPIEEISLEEISTAARDLLSVIHTWMQSQKLI